MNRAGFTLMEVLVVVAIIGLLAAIAVPNYIHALEQSRDDVCAANVDILSTQVERYRMATGQLPQPDENQSLVEFLTERTYLTREVECPRGGEYCLNEQGKVVCDHEK